MYHILFMVSMLQVYMLLWNNKLKELCSKGGFIEKINILMNIKYFFYLYLTSLSRKVYVIVKLNLTIYSLNFNIIDRRGFFSLIISKYTFASNEDLDRDLVSFCNLFVVSYRSDYVLH